MRYTMTLVLCAVLLQGNLLRSRNHKQIRLPFTYIQRDDTAVSPVHPRCVFECQALPGRAGTPRCRRKWNKQRHPAHKLRGWPPAGQIPQIRRSIPVLSWRPSARQWRLELRIPRLPFARLATANDILDSLAREFSIDTNRYLRYRLLHGWKRNVEYHYAVSRAFRCRCPDERRRESSVRLHDVPVFPIWDFHGAVDNLVPVQYSRVMIDCAPCSGQTGGVHALP